MSKYFEKPFAVNGDKTSVPDASQPSGNVSYDEGWTADYELNQETNPNAKDIPRRSENQLKYDITSALKEVQEFGFKVYDALVNYPAKARALGSDGNIYLAKSANGPGTTVVDPVGDSTGTWVSDTLNIPAASAGKRIDIIAGSLRKKAAGTDEWEFINDAGHRPVGVDDPEVTINASGDSLTINFGKTYTKVISFVATGDETMVKELNASVGASVGASSATLKVGVSIQASGVVDNNGVTITDTNLGQFDLNASTSYSAGDAVVSFDAFGGQSPNVYPWTDSGAVAPYMPSIKTFGNSSITVNCITSSGILYTGALTPNISFGWNLTRSGSIKLDGTEHESIENVLTGGLSNIWFYAVMEE